MPVRELIHAKQKDKQPEFRSPLDPLLLRLSKDYIDEADPSALLPELFEGNSFADSESSRPMKRQGGRATRRRRESLRYLG
jgi:hypothetical protein